MLFTAACVFVWCLYLPVLGLLNVGSVLILVCWFIVYDLVAVWFDLFVAWVLILLRFLCVGY